MQNYEPENQDVSQESSPVESQESNGASSGEGQKMQSEQTNQQSNSENVPFHEHPRWKEVMAERNQWQEKSRAMERQFQEMQSEVRRMRDTTTAAQKREDALHSRLKGIDPEFGERFAKLDSSQATIEELKQWKEQFELTQTREKGVSMVNQFHAENKVSKELQSLYNTQIEDAIRANPRATLDDLPEIYKSVHTKMSALFDSMKRADREGYVADKKQAAGVPNNPKGKAPTPGKSASDWSKDPSEARAQLVSRVRAQLRSQD